MGLADGDLYVSGSILSYQQANRMYQNFRGASVPSALKAGALWSKSSDDRLWHQGASDLLEVFTEKTTLTWENLLSNSGFGVWSQSDAAKGLATLTYDTGAKGGGSAPSVGDSLAGGTSGATAKLISYTTTDSWDAGTAYGVLTLGAVTGTFIDNETITFETNQETCLVNGDKSIGITNDPCNNDDTGDWVHSGDSLNFDTDHYEFATSAANRIAYKTGTIKEGRIYKVELDVKDGAVAAGVVIQLYFRDSAAHYGKVITTAAGWASYSATFESDSDVSGRAGIRVVDDLTGDDIEIRNLSLYEITPCCTAGDALAFDGWQKDGTVDIYRQHNDGGTLTKDGSFYALKIVPSAADDWIQWMAAIESNSEFIQKFASRTMTFGAWVKTSTASHARLAIYDGSWHSSSYHAGGGAWEWIEVTVTIGASPTTLAFSFYSDASPAVNGDTIVYISQPMLVFGSHIGEGNYQPKPQEIVYFEDVVLSNLLNSLISQSDIAYATLNLEADSDAKLPKGAKKIHITVGTRDSGSAGSNSYLALRVNAAVSDGFMNSLHGLVNDSWHYLKGEQELDVDGDFEYMVEASGASTFDIGYFAYLGIQLN